MERGERSWATFCSRRSLRSAVARRRRKVLYSRVRRTIGSETGVGGGSSCESFTTGLGSVLRFGRCDESNEPCRVKNSTVVFGGIWTRMLVSICYGGEARGTSSHLWTLLYARA